MPRTVRERGSGGCRACLYLLLVMALLSCSVLIGTASAESETCGNGGGGDGDGDGTCRNEDVAGEAVETDNNNNNNNSNNDDDDDDGKRRYTDDETGAVGYFDPSQQIEATIVNLSGFRVDVYWDDDKYGVNLLTVEAGQSSAVNTFAGHRFFVTRHGVRENMYLPPPAADDNENDDESGGESESDRPLKYEIVKPFQRLVIPAGAAPLSGVRAVKNRCVDRYGMCAREAKKGGCRLAPGWMIVHCCESCDEELNASALLDYDVRCSREQLNMAGPAWGPGDLNRTFEKWVTDEEFAQYTPTVISSPGAKFGGIDGPWIITFDTFLTDFESDQIWEGGQLAGFDRSTDQGKVNEFGEMEQVVSKTRTSSNAWCTDACEKLPGVVSATDKIERVTGVPRANYESFQILQYQKDQFYRMHHDSSSGKDDTPSGHRIMTFFLYLSDVEEGGATRFSRLGLDVTPKKGKALIWPSVLNDDPSTWDPRMYHEARDVVRGEKRAANHWIHLYDYETPNLWGCTGSFS